MKTAVVPALLLLAACATRPASPEVKPAPAPAAPVSAEALVDHWGDSAQTAVSVPANAPNEGVDFENNWIYDHFGRFRRVKYALAHDDQRRFHVVTFELPDASQHTVFFDITELWMRQ